jgi:hypothetical protein
MEPDADFNLLKYPDKEQTKEEIRDLTMLTDILPTVFHGAITAGVRARRLAADEADFEAKAHHRRSKHDE